MAKKKASITCPSCRTVAWRAWGFSHCGSCGTPFGGPGPKGDGGKGNGNKGKEAPEAGKPADSTPGGPPSKSAPGFKFATPAILEPLSEPLRNIVKGMEGLKDRESLLTAAEPVPGLAEAVSALVALRWPATTPDKEAQRDLTRAQQDERTAEKAFGDAQAATAKARAALEELEAAEATALTNHEAAKAKSAAASAKYSALKNSAVSGADAAMTPGDGTIAVEADVGRVRRIIAAKEEAAKSFLQQRDVAIKGMGKGKSSDLRASTEPYVAHVSSDGTTGLLVPPEPGADLQRLADDASKQAATLTGLLATMATFQQQYNEMIAQINSVAGADAEL